MTTLDTTHEQRVETAVAVLAEKKKPRARSGVPAPETGAAASPAIDTLIGGDALRVVMIPRDRLRPHPQNPRKDLGDLTELADSIRAHGVRQNLTVVPDPQHPGDYLTVIGHRRNAAAGLAGNIPAMPSVIDEELTPAEQLELMLVENLQRVDLTAVEEADGYQCLLDLGYTEARIAERTGRSRSTVRNRLRVGALPDKARTAVHGGTITLDDALAIADLPEEEQADIAKKVGTNSFPQALAKAREHAQMTRNAAPLLELLREANVPELPRDEHGAPDGMVYERDVNVLHHPAAAREAVEQLREQVTSGWAYRWWYGWLRVFRPRTLEEAQQRAEQDEERARLDATLEEQRTAAAQARAQREQFARLTAETRREFVEHLVHERKTLTKDQQAAIVEYAADAIVAAPWADRWRGDVFIRAVHEPRDDVLAAWVRAEHDHDLKSLGYSEREIALQEPVATAAAALTGPQRLLAALAASVEPIGEREWETGDRALHVVRWYALLKELGYVPSDDERGALTPAPSAGPNSDDADDAGGES